MVFATAGLLERLHIYSRGSSGSSRGSQGHLMARYEPTVSALLERRDARSLPSNDQEYVFPLISAMARSKHASNCTRPNMHDAAVYSMWMHLVGSFDDVSPASAEPFNGYIRKSRLPFFVDLALTAPAAAAAAAAVEYSGPNDSRSTSDGVKCGYFLDDLREEKYASHDDYKDMNFRDTELYYHHSVPQPLRMHVAQTHLSEDITLSKKSSAGPLVPHQGLLLPLHNYSYLSVDEEDTSSFSSIII
jgi:hypothetical protein